MPLNNQQTLPKKPSNGFGFLLKYLPLLLVYIYRQKVTNFIVNNLPPELRGESESQEKSCIATPSRTDTCRADLFFPCNSEAVLAMDKDSILNHLKMRSGGAFNSSAVHTNIVNHHYEAALNIVKAIPEHRDELLNDCDSNKRTPLHIALEVGAPADVIAELLTRQNVMMADKKGVTPLMLAMRGTDPLVTKAIFEAIGPERIAVALATQDNEGKTASQWNDMSRDALLARFTAIEVDGTKDKNYCTNSFFHNNKYTALAIPSFPQIADNVYRIAGFEVGVNNWVGKGYPAIKATKGNAELLHYHATSELRDARWGLSVIWGGGDDRSTPLWQYVDQHITAITDKLSGTTLVDSYVANQAENGKLLDHYTQCHSPHVANLQKEKTTAPMHKIAL